MDAQLKKNSKSEIPIRITDNELLTYINDNHIDYKYVDTLKKIAHTSDSIISELLNVTSRTLRNYRSEKRKTLNTSLSEKLVLLISLYKHGEEVFDSTEKFNDWLDSDNFFFDNDHPRTFLKTITGIRFIEDRLTGIEYGDNA